MGKACNGVVHVIDEVLALEEESKSCGFDGYSLKTKLRGKKFKRVGDACECERRCGEKRSASERNIWSLKKNTGKCTCFGEHKRGIKVKKDKKSVASHSKSSK